ncbi:MAG: hypothetical protein M4579_002221 [Chaenotheca gracillima]|nr:MAG: hypothetical protein M4579_002221 [Chaenotheca gracillima]
MPASNLAFLKKTHIANYIDIFGLVSCVFVLLSFLVLPKEKTHRHYLSICLVIGVGLMQLGFIIPLGTKPNQCYDDITPNDMESNTSCALSGFFLIAGGWCGVMWVFLRALSLHLQICWQVVPGPKFFLGAQFAGWGIPAVMVSVAMTLTGVSYRFGDTCHINHQYSVADFWGPLLAFTGAAIVIQFGTFGYCIKVYLQSLMDDTPSSDNRSGLPSYQGSIRTVTARQAYRRVRKVVELQWRGIAIVVFIIASVVFYSVVFAALDNMQQASLHNLPEAQPWLLCLITSGGDKNKCAHLAAKLTINETTIMAVLVLMSMNGIWALIFLGRWSMVTGWYDLIKGRVRPHREFVSVDARRFSNGPSGRAYEMLKSPASAAGMKSPDTAPIISPVAKVYSPTGGRDSPDYFGHIAGHTPPRRSSSTTKAPGREWDPQSTHARGGGVALTTPRRNGDDKPHAF